MGGRKAHPGKPKLEEKHHKYERRIFSFDDAARVLARLEEPNLLVIETCIATGARISEVLVEMEECEFKRRHDQDRAACLAPGS